MASLVDLILPVVIYEAELEKQKPKERDPGSLSFHEVGEILMRYAELVGSGNLLRAQKHEGSGKGVWRGEPGAMLWCCTVACALEELRKTHPRWYNDVVEYWTAWTEARSAGARARSIDIRRRRTHEDTPEHQILGMVVEDMGEESKKAWSRAHNISRHVGYRRGMEWLAQRFWNIAGEEPGFLRKT